MISSEATVSDLLSPADSNDILDENLDKPKRSTVSAAKTSGWYTFSIHWNRQHLAHFDHSSLSKNQIVASLRLGVRKRASLAVKMRRSVDTHGK